MISNLKYHVFKDKNEEKNMQISSGEDTREELHELEKQKKEIFDVRNSLHNKSVAKYEKRISDFEVQVNNQISKIAEDNKKMFNTLEKYIKEEVSVLNNKIKEEQNERVNQIKKTQKDYETIRDAFLNNQEDFAAYQRVVKEKILENAKELTNELKDEQKIRSGETKILQSNTEELFNLINKLDTNSSNTYSNLNQTISKQVEFIKKQLLEENKERNNSINFLNQEIKTIETRQNNIEEVNKKKQREIKQQITENNKILTENIPTKFSNFEENSKLRNAKNKEDIENVKTVFEQVKEENDVRYSDIREQILQLTKSITYELQSQDRDISNKIRTETEKQRRTGMKRTDLATMFTELALKISENGKN